jgi:hypothetical protein
MSCGAKRAIETSAARKVTKSLNIKEDGDAIYA